MHLFLLLFWFLIFSVGKKKRGGGGGIKLAFIIVYHTGETDPRSYRVT